MPNKITSLVWRILTVNRTLLISLLRLSVKPGRAKDHSNVSAEAHEALKNELQQKERALADQAVELAILRKKTSGGSWDR